MNWAEEIVRRGLAPAAAMAWGEEDTASFEATVPSDAFFDVASLTKVIATTAVAAALVRDGRLSLEDKAGNSVPESSVREASVADLLAHRSGLPAYWNPPAGATPEDVRASILRIPPEDAVTVYSCLGFITLQAVLERSSGRSLDVLFEESVARPLGLAARFGPVPSALPTSAETGGSVHDPLARALGGVSGNAGLFASIEDLARFAQAVVRREPAVATLWDWGVEVPPNQGRGLGWQVFEPGLFGHTGFTGCRIWFSSHRGRWAALLTNRVTVDRDPSEFKSVADEFRDLALFRT